MSSDDESDDVREREDDDEIVDDEDDGDEDGDEIVDDEIIGRFLMNLRVDPIQAMKDLQMYPQLASVIENDSNRIATLLKPYPNAQNEILRSSASNLIPKLVNLLKQNSIAIQSIQNTVNHLMKFSEWKSKIPTKYYSLTSPEDLVEVVKILNFSDDGVIHTDRRRIDLAGKKYHIFFISDPNLKIGHWTCGIKNQTGDRHLKFYFDSFGSVFPSSLDRYMSKTVMVNTKQVQYKNSNSCGLYCLYVCQTYSKLCDVSNKQYNAEVFERIVKMLD